VKERAKGGQRISQKSMQMVVAYLKSLVGKGTIREAEGTGKAEETDWTMTGPT